MKKGYLFLFGWLLYHSSPKDKAAPRTQQPRKGKKQSAQGIALGNPK